MHSTFAPMGSHSVRFAKQYRADELDHGLWKSGLLTRLGSNTRRTIGSKKSNGSVG